ncbi:hypothetical protein ACLVWU_00125 [Bdellovibrio sp. HCB290]|uniref:hypothetical protein n=1 Tax=Bdellovibrio sp. HCB290 TaxID=3394356 RepID=UPI0039B3FAF0
MEPELERNRPTPQRKPQPGSYNRGPQKGPVQSQKREPVHKRVDETAFERKTFAQETSVIVGLCLIVMGFVGFVMDNFLGAHLSYSHNIIHLITGSALVWFGFKQEVHAKKCALIVGSFFAVIGILGYVVGTPGIPTVGRTERDDFLWIVSPERLEMGTRDHNIHLLAAALLLGAALFKFRRRRLEGL